METDAVVECYGSWKVVMVVIVSMIMIVVRSVIMCVVMHNNSLLCTLAVSQHNP